MTYIPRLLARKQTVMVPVKVDGEPHRVNARKLNLYYTRMGRGTIKVYARAGMHGEMVPLKSTMEGWFAPALHIETVKPTDVTEE